MLMADDLDKIGFIVDYGRLDWIKQYLDQEVEHRHLNEVFGFNPTAENLAKHFHDLFKVRFPQVFSVRVKETEKTEAVYADILTSADMMNQFTEAMSGLKQVIDELSKP